MRDKWTSAKLGELCDILDSKRKPITKKDRIPGEYPYYGATGVLDYVEDYIFDEKLILIGEDGAKWGAGENTAFTAEGKYWVNNHAHVIRPHREIVLDPWVIYYLNANDLSPFITGLTVPKLNQGKLRDIPIPLPPLPEQKRIVAILDGLSAKTKSLESIYCRKLTALAELKQSLLQKAFSGELTEAIATTNVIAFPKTIPGISTTDLHAGILAMAYQMHEKNPKDLKTFGRVKAEKIAHMVEAYLGFDLGRKPVKDAAGPNDFRKFNFVNSRARKAAYFHFKKTGVDRYSFVKFKKFDRILEKTREALGDENDAVDKVLKIMLPMDTKQSEIFATVFAAWNNLLIRNEDASDETIVYEARENWHEDKLRIPRLKFFKAIEWMRKNNMTPKGKGELVAEKTNK